MTIRVAGITEDSIVDGPGLRLTVFVQGCPHHCPGCHNPETWSFEGGKDMAMDEISELIITNSLLDGLTISGGEPFSQASACLELVRRAQRWGLDVWVYTGYTWEVLLQRAIPEELALLCRVDVLVDGQFIEAQRTLELPWRGSKNQRLIDVQKSLACGSVVEVQGSR